MIKIKKILILFLLVFFICPTITFAFGKKEVNVYLFYSETCPHCAAEHKYLDSIKDKYDLNIYSYEVSNPDSVEKLEKISKYLDVSSNHIYVLPFINVAGSFILYSPPNGSLIAFFPAISLPMNLYASI